MKRSLLCLALLGASIAALASENVNDLPFNAVQEKKNVEITVLNAAVAELGDSGGTLNGFQGATTDFQNQRLPLWAILKSPLADERAMVLAERQGRLQGTLRCARVRVGSSPSFPLIKLGVLAQDCEISKLQ